MGFRSREKFWVEIPTFLGDSHLTGGGIALHVSDSQEMHTYIHMYIYMYSIQCSFLFKILFPLGYLLIGY